jgi:hypothetical protein
MLAHRLRGHVIKDVIWRDHAKSEILSLVTTRGEEINVPLAEQISGDDVAAIVAAAAWAGSPILDDVKAWSEQEQRAA